MYSLFSDNLKTQAIFFDLILTWRRSKKNWIKKPAHEKIVRGAIQNYVDFCCRIFILQPFASFWSQNKVLS